MFRANNERTPLTGQSDAPPGPSYVFPGGVPARSRRNKHSQLQWCIAFIVLAILFSGLMVAFILTYNDIYPTPVAFPVIINPENYSSANLMESLLNDTPLEDEPESVWHLTPTQWTQHQHDAAVADGIRVLGDREVMEEKVPLTPVNSPEFRHYRSLTTTTMGRKLSRRGIVENAATVAISKSLNYTKPPERSDIGRGPPIVLPDSTANFNCDFNAHYRRANGICNNKHQPRLYGASMVPYRRMVAPDYADGISAPRESHNADVQLPSARNVSVNIYRPSYKTDSNFTVMLAVFGQFLDHDITATSLTVTQDGESIDCCTAPLSQHPECFPVLIPKDDPYYGRYNITCMNFVRSAPAPTGHFGPRQHLNQATSFIDASVVYGNSEERQRNLRSEENGTLRMYITPNGRELLPISTDLNDGCNRVEMSRQGKYCFESGDDRSNENLLLSSMHLLWAREHNHLAKGLQEQNPDWDDETVYQETRRIVGAEMAHISYNEFLPVLFGREFAQKKGLLPQTNNLNAPDTYDKTIDPRIANAFASAAFRFAHSLLPSLLNMTRDNNSAPAIELHKMLFNPFSLWSETGVDAALISASETNVQSVDRFFSEELTHKLFEVQSEKRYRVCGLDLVSLNIQRGRDHGLPAYPVFRKHCNLPATDTWEEMKLALDPASYESIRKIYSTPDDVDLYTGALSEPPLAGAIFGPLLTCIVSDQFLRLKIGDSFWYERKMGPQKFSKDQLREIYKTSLAAIICRNSDAIVSVRKHVMERFDETKNPYFDCKDLIKFNYTAWDSEAMKQKWQRVSMSNPMTKPRIIRKQKQLNATLSTDDK